MKFTTSFLFRAVCLLALALLAIPALLAGSAGDLSHLCVMGMAAATLAIDTPERSGTMLNLPVAATTKIYAGTLVALNATGYLVSASNTAGLRVIGRAEADVDNSAGADGDLSADVKISVFRFDNSGANALTIADIGATAFVEDNQTVASTASNKVKAGRVMAIDDDGVWINTEHASVVPAADTITGAADLAALKTALLALLQGAGLVK